MVANCARSLAPEIVTHSLVEEERPGGISNLTSAPFVESRRAPHERWLLYRASPQHDYGAGLPDTLISGYERQTGRLRGSHDERIEGITRESQIIRYENLIGRQIEGLIGRIADAKSACNASSARSSSGSVVSISMVLMTDRDGPIRPCFRASVTS